MINGSENLRRYVETQSEEAFRVIVESHLRLVYSAALRLVNGDGALASDISQVVFADLAAKANTLPSDAVLSGWLYRHTCFTAAKMLRSEQRRRIREREAVLMNATGASAEQVWDQVAPFLEEGMNSLGSTDRNAILLRFFEGQDLRSVGLALGASEDAAQKRISRAIEKLRRFFLKKGVSVSGTALIGFLAAQASSAVPGGLASAVTASALAGGFVAVSTLPTLFTSLIIMTKIKAIVIGTAVVAAIATPLILQHQTISRLRAENHALQEHLGQPNKVPQSTSSPALTAAETERMQNEHAELLRLRAETARLRGQQQELSRLQDENKRLKTVSDRPAPSTHDKFVSSATWANLGFNSPLDSLQTAHWAVRNADIQRFKESMLFTESAKQYLTNLMAKMPGDILAEAQKQGFGLEEGLLFPMIAKDRNIGYKGYRVLSEETPAENEILLNVELEMNSGKTEKNPMRFQRVGTDWRHVIDAVDLQRLEAKESAGKVP
jgi:RNA polymerase sigma factor (sigma-70 family)